MNLRTNSLQAKLYRYFWSTDKLPENLCPYFWMSLIMYVFIIPYAIISFPLQKVSYRDDIPTIGMWFLGAIGYGAIYLLVSMVAMWFVLGNETYSWIVSSGICGWALVVIISMIAYAHHRKELKEEAIDAGTYQEGIVVSFVKAKYNRYCPKITWK